MYVYIYNITCVYIYIYIYVERDIGRAEVLRAAPRPAGGPARPHSFFPAAKNFIPTPPIPAARQIFVFPVIFFHLGGP